MTIWFYVFLYGVGLFCVLPLSNKIPLWFLLTTGFLWGKLIWVFCTTITLFFGITYSIGNMIILMSGVILIAATINISRRTLKLTPQQYLYVVFGTTATFAISYFLTKRYYLFATEDSFSIIIIGRLLAQFGLQPWTINRFTSWGLLAPVFQMTSSLLGEGFISGYQTLLAGSLIGIFAISLFQAFHKYFHYTISLLLSCLFVLVFITRIFIEHAIYIHTNLTATVFIYIALFAYWNFLKNESSEWVILGSIAMIGVSFTRVEGPLYAVLFSSLAICAKQLMYKDTLRIILPFTILSLGWNLFLYFSGDQSGILNQTNIIIILLALAGLIVLGFGSKWIPKISRLQFLVIGILGIGLIAAFIIKPDHMWTSLLHIVQNLTSRNSWSFSWVVILLLFPLVIELNNHKPENRFILFGITGYLLLVLLFSFSRTPYRLGPTDSANRLLLQIQPVIFFYIAVNSNKIKELFLSQH